MPSSHLPPKHTDKRVRCAHGNSPQTGLLVLGWAREVTYSCSRAQGAYGTAWRSTYLRCGATRGSARRLAAAVHSSGKQAQPTGTRGQAHEAHSDQDHEHTARVLGVAWTSKDRGQTTWNLTQLCAPSSENPSGHMATCLSPEPR